MAVRMQEGDGKKEAVRLSKDNMCEGEGGWGCALRFISGLAAE